MSVVNVCNYGYGQEADEGDDTPPDVVNIDPMTERGRVQPGTKDSLSRSRSESSGGPTKYKQCWNLLLQIGQPLGMCS